MDIRALFASAVLCITPPNTVSFISSLFSMIQYFLKSSPTWKSNCEFVLCRRHVFSPHIDVLKF